MHYLYQNKKDEITELFIIGLIDKETYFKFEDEFNKNEKIFTICLN